jgi:hypothetical protein
MSCALIHAMSIIRSCRGLAPKSTRHQSIPVINRERDRNGAALPALPETGSLLAQPMPAMA